MRVPCQRTSKNINAVKAAVIRRGMSVRRVAAGLGAVTLRTPYKLQMLQELEEGDSEMRVVFAEEQLEHMEHDQNFHKNLFFSDEAHFHLHGGVNTYDFRC